MTNIASGDVMQPEVAALKDQYFGADIHPFRQLEALVAAHLTPTSVLLDAGCGRTAPVLQKFAEEKKRRLIGVDVVEFQSLEKNLELHRSNLNAIALDSNTVDLVVSRSVLEHLDDPLSVYREIHRILKPGGRFIFLTANFYDYASIIAAIVPNRFHGKIVRFAEGRAEEDVFPTRYRTNTRRAIHRLAKATQFEIETLQYLGQYPSYLLFSPFWFRLGAYYELILRRFPSLNFLQGWILTSLVKQVN